MYNKILKFVTFCYEQTFYEVTCLHVTALQRLLLLNLWHDAVGLEIVQHCGILLIQLNTRDGWISNPAEILNIA